MGNLFFALQHYTANLRVWLQLHYEAHEQVGLIIFIVIFPAMCMSLFWSWCNWKLVDGKLAVKVRGKKTLFDCIFKCILINIIMEWGYTFSLSHKLMLDFTCSYFQHGQLFGTWNLLISCLCWPTKYPAMVLMKWSSGPKRENCGSTQSAMKLVSNECAHVKC